MESKDLLKEELARIKSQSEDERLRIVNQMKERESEFFEQLKSEKRLREQFLKDQVEHNLISLAEDTQRLSPTPKASRSELKLPTGDEREKTVAEKETLTEEVSTIVDNSLKQEIGRLESEVKISNDTCDRLRRDIEKLKEAYVKLKKELTDERNAQNSLKEGNESFTKEVNKLQSDLHNLMDENETLLTEKNNIIKALTDKVSLKEEEIASLKSSHESALKEIGEKLNAEIEKSRESNEEKAVLRSEIERLTSQVIELTESLEAKTVECGVVELSVKEKSDELEKVRQELKETNLRNESKCKSLKELADTARNRSDDLTRIKFDLENKLEEAVRKVELEREKNESLVDEIAKVKGEKNEMKLKHEEILHALHELGREHSSLQVEGEKLKSKKWVDDDAVTECTRCRKPFSVTTRKHHCRSCFNIFCSDCSPLRRTDPSPSLGTAASLLKGSITGGTRICEDCFGHSSTKSS